MDKLITFILILALCWGFSSAQSQKAFTKKELLALELPENLRLINGKKVRRAKKWESKRRPELLALFENLVYGKIPGELDYSSVDAIEEGNNAISNKAIRKQVLLTFKKGNLELPVNLLMYLPKTKKKVPVFLGYNSTGNHSVIYDPEIFLTEAWVIDNPSLGIINNQITEQSRGVMSSHWPIEKIIDSGYGLVTFYYGEIDPDKDDFTDGAHPFFYDNLFTRPNIKEWGAIAAWAWGLIKAMDYLHEEEMVDEERVIAIGHSQLGKAALWASALDERFAMVITNNSGIGGAALFNWHEGEAIKDVNDKYQHWFCDGFNYYNFNERVLPIDQHNLIGLIAPRPVYIANRLGGHNPAREFLSAYFATPVYKLYGKKGIEEAILPKASQPIMNQVGYHLRYGKSGNILYDWQQYILFADFHLKNNISGN